MRKTKGALAVLQRIQKSPKSDRSGQKSQRWAARTQGQHRTRGSRGWDRACPGVPDNRDRLGEAHSRGGCAWLPGTVGHGHSRRDLEQKPAKVRGSSLTPRWEPQAGPPGARAGEADPGAGRPLGRRPRDPLLRDRVLEAAPRSPRPAQAPTSRLFSPLKKLSRDLGCGDAPTKRPRPLRPHAQQHEPSAPIG